MTRSKTLLLSVVIAVGLAAAVLMLAVDNRPDDDGGLRGAVLILLDTARADRFSCYGHGRDTTPEIAGLAEEGVLFEQAVSYSSWTLPSVLNILSASPVDERIFAEQRLQSSLVEEIAAAGYRTSAVTEGGYVSRHFGIDRGFAEFYEEEGAVQLQKNGAPIGDGASGGIEKTFRRARAWLSENRSGKFFLLIHTYEPHTPYTRRDFVEGMDPGRVGPVFPIKHLNALQGGQLALNASETDYVSALYDGGLRNADRHVGEFMEFLEEIGLREKTLVVVTSDHGEELGEHFPAYIADHGHSLHDEQLLVPLVVVNPAADYPVRRVSSQVRLMDVMPTIADLLGVPTGNGLAGKSLVPLATGEESGERVAYGYTNKVGPVRFYVRVNGYKMIRTIAPAEAAAPLLRPRPAPLRLFDLAEDAGETRNIVKDKPGLARQMSRIMSDCNVDRAADGTVGDVNDLDEQARERLKSLGYLR